MRIFLIGFMGSGKSKFSKKLGQLLNQPSIDLDNYIEEKYKQSINNIFKEKGEDYFRQIERQALHKIIEQNKDFVMSCGGGTPCFFNNLDWMNKYGLSIYLKVSESILFGRLKDSKMNRPLIAKLNDEQLRTYVANELTKRSAYYERANKVSDFKNVTAKKLLSLI